VYHNFLLGILSMWSVLEVVPNIHWKATSNEILEYLLGKDVDILYFNYTNSYISIAAEVVCFFLKN
jgi:hypothetical protein